MFVIIAFIENNVISYFCNLEDKALRGRNLSAKL
jgi:hypothetical protein